MCSGTLLHRPRLDKYDNTTQQGTHEHSEIVRGRHAILILALRTNDFSCRIRRTQSISTYSMCAWEETHGKRSRFVSVPLRPKRRVSPKIQVTQRLLAPNIRLCCATSDACIDVFSCGQELHEARTGTTLNRRYCRRWILQPPRLPWRQHLCHCCTAPLRLGLV